MANEKLPPVYAQWLRFVLQSSAKHGVEPALIFAVMSRETGGRNIVGDGGHGRGLMQIDDRSHKAFLDANEQGMNPVTNIDYGTKILRANISAFPGNLKAALAAYNAGASRVRAAVARGADPDSVTTGRNYGADVLARRERFAPMLAEEPTPPPTPLPLPTPQPPPPPVPTPTPPGETPPSSAARPGAIVLALAVAGGVLYLLFR